METDTKAVLRTPLSHDRDEEFYLKFKDKGVSKEEIKKHHYFILKEGGDLLKSKDNIFLLNGNTSSYIRDIICYLDEGTIIASKTYIEDQHTTMTTHELPRIEGEAEYISMRMSSLFFPITSETLHTQKMKFNIDLEIKDDEELNFMFKTLRKRPDPKYRKAFIDIILNQGPLNFENFEKRFSNWNDEACHALKIMEKYLYKECACANTGCSHNMEFIDIYMVQNPRIEEESIIAAYPVCDTYCADIVFELFFSCFKNIFQKYMPESELRKFVKRVSINDNRCCLCNKKSPPMKCPYPCMKSYCGKECQRKHWPEHKKSCPNSKHCEKKRKIIFL